MYICIHICKYVCANIHVYLCIFIHLLVIIHIYLYMYTYSYTYTHLHIYVYVYIYIFILMHICGQTCSLICICIFIFIYILYICKMPLRAAFSYVLKFIQIRLYTHICCSKINHQPPRNNKLMYSVELTFENVKQTKLLRNWLRKRLIMRLRP